MSAPEPQQVFVRNDKGRLWGPITLPTLELLLDNGLIDGRIQVSKDGINFAFPGRFPDIREFVPPELWGEGAPPAGAARPAPAATASSVIAPPPPPGMTPGAPPTAGPGAAPAAGPGAAPIAGPGGSARPGAPVAPMAGPGATARPVAPGGPVAGPGASQGSGLRAGPGAVTASQQARSVPAGQRPAPVVGPPLAGPAPGAAPTTAAAPRPGPPVAPPAPAASPAPAAPAAASATPEPPAKGDLATTSPIRLYYLAASGDLTGLLTLRLSDRVIEIHFRKGNPEYVGSNHPDDALGGFLLKENLAKPGQIAEAEAEMDRFGGDLVAALFGKGILNPTNAFTHLAQRAQGLLLKAILATSGTFEYAAKEFPLAKTLPLGNRWSVLMELVRRVPAAEIRRRLADVADNPVMKSGGLVAVSDLRLTPQETRAIGYVDGVRSLNLLARDLPQDADAFFRLAWALREMDIVSFAAVKLSMNPPPAAASAPTPPPAAGASATAPTGPTAAGAAATAPTGPTAAASPKPAVAAAPGSATPGSGASAAGKAPAAGPAVARPAAPPPKITAPSAGPGAKPASAPPAAPATPSAPIDYEAELKTLRAAVAKLKDQTKFQVLEITDKADAGAVKLAYFKLAKIYHPDTVPQDAPAEYGKLKGEIFAAVGDAYRTLSDDKSRAEYIEDLKHGGGGDIDVAAILHAEELFQKGCILVKAKKFPEAVEMLTEAIQANPEEGEFYAWRAIARYYVSTDKKQGLQESDRDLALALRKNPRCAQAYFFMGQIARLSNDTKKALQQFQKTLELQPDHLDAQREIRYLKK